MMKGFLHVGVLLPKVSESCLQLLVLGLFMSNLPIGQGVFFREVVSAGIAGKGFLGEIFLGETHATKRIRDDIILALDVGQLGTVLFYDETPSHDAFGIESLVHKILVVGKDFDLLT